METNLELQRLTNVDGLTGLSNRRYFNEYIEAEWKRAVRAQTPLSILMIDVDHFKQYNDTYGHIAGDEVLRESPMRSRQSSGDRPISRRATAARNSPSYFPKLPSPTSSISAPLYSISTF